MTHEAWLAALHKQITLRVSETEYEAFRARAHEVDLDLTTWIRLTCRGAVGVKTTETGSMRSLALVIALSVGGFGCGLLPKAKGSHSFTRSKKDIIFLSALITIAVGSVVTLVVVGIREDKAER